MTDDTSIIAPDHQNKSNLDSKTKVIPDTKTDDTESGKTHRSKIIAIVNQKGGVGKTTTAINLGTGLAAVGRSVLIVDLDPQGNASTGLGIDRKSRGRSSYDLMVGTATLPDVIVETLVPGLHLVPSTLDLSGAEIELVSLPKRHQRLATALEPTAEAYDFVLIDCPPSLSMLTLNALVASDAVLVPLQCEFFALEGLTLLLRTIEQIRKRYNPKLKMEGVILTMFDRRNRLSDQVAQDVRKFLGDKVYRTIIPRNVRVSEAPSHGKPALLYDHRCAGSHAYMKLASELLAREKEQMAA